MFLKYLLKLYITKEKFNKNYFSFGLLNANFGHLGASTKLKTNFNFGFSKLAKKYQITPAYFTYSTVQCTCTVDIVLTKMATNRISSDQDGHLEDPVGGWKREGVWVLRGN